MSEDVWHCLVQQISFKAIVRPRQRDKSLFNHNNAIFKAIVRPRQRDKSFNRDNAILKAIVQPRQHKSLFNRDNARVILVLRIISTTEPRVTVLQTYFILCIGTVYLNY